MPPPDTPVGDPNGVNGIAGRITFPRVIGQVEVFYRERGAGRFAGEADENGNFSAAFKPGEAGRAKP